jgi:hypothetical protein
MAKKFEMVVIQDGKALEKAIDDWVDSTLSNQDRAHMLAVSGMYHYWLHGDSSKLTRLTSGITKCHGSNKKKLIGYLVETCGLKWDTTNLRFKKATDSTFTKASGVEEFPEYQLMNCERWYEFDDGSSEVPSWLLKKVLQKANKSIADNEDDARTQVSDAWSEFEALQNTMREVGLSETFIKAA